MPVRIAPRSKFHAVPTWVDGIRFASAREARRYGELRLLERAGLIRDLTLQPAFELHATVWPAPAGPPHVVGIYRADFAYVTETGTVVEDAKGVRTALYQWKKKHVEIEYGVRIVEV
jgi:Protein of unknown function (DUF1064)